MLTPLVLAALAAAPARWEYSSAVPGHKPPSGTLTTYDRDGTTYVSARHFCFALGCKTTYQWANQRLVLSNPAERSSALVSPVAGISISNGHVIDFKGKIISDPKGGYLLPVDLATRLAGALKLGRIRPVGGEDARIYTAGSAAADGDLVLVIDPGHGGSDLGTGVGGIHEKDVAMIYALRLRDEVLERLPGVKVLLTRDSDTYVSLPDRARIANASRANFFLSIHVNHAADPKVEGVETYILSPDATDDDARKVALLENETWLKSSDIKDTTEIVKKILIDVEQTKYIQHSALAAAIMQQEVSELEKTHGLRSRGVKQAMFYVLSQVAMPSTLIEMGFLSSNGDRGRLMNVVFRNEFVRGLVTALKRYREKLSRGG